MKSFRVMTTAVSALGALLISTAAMAQNAGRETLQLSLADAVQRAVEHNPDLAVVKLESAAQVARIAESKGTYAPLFSTSLGRSSNVSPPSNSLLGDSGVAVRDWFSSTGVKQRMPWGNGTWSVSWDTS